MKIFGVVYAKPVASARADFGDAGKIPVLFSFERMKCSLGIFRRVLLDHKMELVCLWRPNTKMRFLFADQFRANRIATFCECHHLTLILINCTTIVRFGNFSLPIQHRQSRTWGRSLRKQPRIANGHSGIWQIATCSTTISTIK